MSLFGVVYIDKSKISRDVQSCYILQIALAPEVIGTHQVNFTISKHNKQDFMQNVSISNYTALALIQQLNNYKL